MNEVLKKLNFKSGKLWIIGLPTELKPLIAEWEKDAQIIKVAQPEGAQAFGLVFLEDETQARSLGFAAAPSIAPGGVLWFAYPKRTSKRYKSNLTRNKLWEIFKGIGLQAVRQVAIDMDWSALRFKRAD